MLFCRVKDCGWHTLDGVRSEVEHQHALLQIHMQEHIVELLQKILTMNGGKP